MSLRRLGSTRFRVEAQRPSWLRKSFSFFLMFYGVVTSYSIFQPSAPVASLSCSISSHAERVADGSGPVSRAAEGLEGASEPVCGCL